MQAKQGQNGFSLIELLIVVAIIGIIAAIAIPNLLASRRAANEGSAIASVRTIGTAQATFLTTVGGNKDYATNLPALLTAGLVDSVLGSATGIKTGYTFVGASAVGSVTYTTTAAPVSASTGTRGFFSNETGVIRAKTGLTAAAVGDPPIQ